MPQASASFGFLKPQSEQQYWLPALAENKFRIDPDATLFKLRQFADLIAKDVCAHNRLLRSPDDRFPNLPRELSRSGRALESSSTSFISCITLVISAPLLLKMVSGLTIWVQI